VEPAHDQRSRQDEAGADLKASVTRATKPKWQITCSFGLIAAGFAYNYPLKYFPASQPDGTDNLDLPDVEQAARERRDEDGREAVRLLVLEAVVAGDVAL
jgi:hypothetical protein